MSVVVVEGAIIALIAARRLGKRGESRRLSKRDLLKRPNLVTISQL